MIIARSRTSSGRRARFITMKRSVMGVVSAIKRRADIPPRTRKRTNILSLMLSLVIESESQESGCQLQNTPSPPLRRRITLTLNKAKITGATKIFP